MADRYWVGGTGSWSSTNTANWSASSGGASGASVPTAADNVIFDAGSDAGGIFTVTMANSPRLCNNFTASGLDFTMTLAGGGVGLTVSGSLTFQATNFSATYTGDTIFNATTTGKTVTTNGVAFSGGVIFDGAGGGWTLGSALTAPTNPGGKGTNLNTTALNRGTLDLQSYTLSTGLFNSSNSNTRTIAFGTGQISCTFAGTVWTTATYTGLTTTGTQVVNVTSTGSTAITVTPGPIPEINSISFNFTGGTYALTFLVIASNTARNVNFTGYAGTWNATSTGIIFGNLTLSSGMTLTASASTLTFAATSGTKTITTNAKTIAFPVNFNGIGGTWQLQDALTLTTALTFTNGTVNLNGFTLSALGASLALGTKNITFNGGTLLLSGSGNSWNAANNPNNFTTTAGTGTGAISMTNAFSKNFFGGGRIYNCTLNQGGAGALTIADGANTFSNITNTRKSVSATSILFTAGTTSTFTDWNASGESTRLLTIGSDTAASHTLSKASGTVSADFLSISRSTATGGAGWYAGANSTDGGNNSGWIFTAPPAPTATGNFLVFF